MAEKALTQIDPRDAAIAAEAATKGDLSKLSPDQRTQLYGAVCKSMGLNPLSQPFAYITLNGKLTLYATRTATDQLRNINGVSITKVEKEIFDGVLTVTVNATDASGRTDMEIGAVMIGGLKGEALANAHMKALTKAKRRVTLSICGLGWLDESEISSVPTATATVVDLDTGEIEPDDNSTAMRRIHAVAREYGITHEALHGWAVTRGHESLKDMTSGDLNALSDVFGAQPNMAERFIEKYQSMNAPDVIEIIPEQADLINDPELQAASDRVQAAARARQ